jgi:WD40 repeat protein
MDIEVQLLCNVTGLSDSSQALALLEACDGNLNEAVAVYLDQDGCSLSQIANQLTASGPCVEQRESERRDECAVAVVFGVRKGNCITDSNQASQLRRRRSKFSILDLDQSIMRIVLDFLVRMCLHFSLDGCASSFCCYSPDGKTILCSSKDKTLKLFDASTGKMLNTLQGHTAGVRSCSWSPDGRFILSGAKDTKLILWTAQGDLLKTFVGHSNVVRSCCFSPDGTKFLADFRRTLKVYDAATQKVLHTLEGHFSDDGCSCFSPNGHQILGVDGTSLKLWSAELGVIVHTLCGHSEDISCCW